jgi:ribosomal-protein-alanine N-acetyltransferase
MTVRVFKASPQLADRFADVHAACFPRPWSQREIASLMQLPGTLGFALETDGTVSGLVLVRQAADEAEILTIGVRPQQRRTGAGAQLLAACEAALRKSGCERIFLEVAVGNDAAKGLYAGAGYREVGRRKAYYADGSDALVLEKWLCSDGQIGASAPIS